MTFPWLLTADEVAAVLRITPRQAYRLVARGELAGVRVGEVSVRVDADELASYIKSRRVASSEMREPAFERAQGSRDDDFDGER